MVFSSNTGNVRLTAAIMVAVIEIALGFVLFAGWHAQPSVRTPPDLNTFQPMVTRPPPEPPRLREAKTPRKNAAAAPPNLRARPTEIMAPPPVLPAIIVPVTTAPAPATGRDASAGASDMAGPGTGSGGIGSGTGGGSGGAGDGDGGNDTPPRLRSGRLKNSDYPVEVGSEGVSGTVSVRYVVETDGRVGRCAITRSSGSRILDETTCRLIRERFRFDPSRDEQGRPVAAALVEDHSWYVHREDGPPR